MDSLIFRNLGQTYMFRSLHNPNGMMA